MNVFIAIISVLIQAMWYLAKGLWKLASWPFRTTDLPLPELKDIIHHINFESTNIAKQVLERDHPADSISELELEALADKYPNLWHFISDEDVRKRDPEYMKRQKETLVIFLDHLSKGEYELAGSISFL